MSQRDPFSVAGAGKERTEQRADAPGPRFTAQFTTTCPGCGSEIEPGDDARMFEGQAHHDETYCLDGWEPDPTWRRDHWSSWRPISSPGRSDDLR